MSAALPSASPGAVLPLMLACSGLWGTAFLLIKLIGPGIDPLTLTALRGVMGGVLVGGWLLALGQRPWPRRREWRDWAVLGVLQGIIPNTLTAYALVQITTAMSSMIQATTPLIVAVIAHFAFAEEHLSPRRLVGVVTGFVGMALLIGPEIFDSRAGAMGVAAMVVTAVSYAVGNLYIRGIPGVVPARLAFGQQAFAGFPTLVVVLFLFGAPAFAAVPAHALELIALGVFATALPIVLYMTILHRAGPTLGSMNSYLIPIWTTLLGTTLLGEAIAPREIVGGCVVIAGLLIVASARRRAV
jgi:drug/metabolite transporter (DMT)-like permease